MPDPCDVEELTRRFRDTSAAQDSRAPLYGALCAGIADDEALVRVLCHAPPQQRLPVLLLACTHALLLAEPDEELAQWYPNLTAAPLDPHDAELLPAFSRFVNDRMGALVALLERRATQTNEVGRCLLLLPAFGLLDAECGPLAHLDVGASGGLNLLLDRFAYRYTSEEGRPLQALGGPSTVELHASIRGAVPLPDTMPSITARLGLDVEPIDVTDDDAARWLEACVWPDQPDRFLRLRAAIGIARSDPPEILAGDAIGMLGPAIERMQQSGHPVVTNSWVLNYLTTEQRTAYVAELDRIGAASDLSWVFVESPSLTSELPWVITPQDPYRTELALARWRAGVRSVEQLATCHPHGYWLHGHPTR